MYQSPRERANLVDIDEEEDDDEEETIIDMRGKGGGIVTSSFSSALAQDKLRGEPPARYPSGASSSQPPPPSPRRMSSPTAKLRSPPPSSPNDNLHNQQSHSIQVGQQETRAPSLSISSAPLMGKFQSVLTATTQVVNHLDTVADSVAEAMSLLQHPFGGSSNSHHHQQQHQNRKAKDREAYNIESKLQEARNAHTRLKLLAFWQLLLTGFEVSFTCFRVLKFAIGKRALWLALDGKLYLTHAKNDKKPNKRIFLADIYKVQKGSEAQSFTKSQSWRDARGSGKEQLCFSIHGNCGSRRQQHQDGSVSSGGEKTFALQVRVASVRNVIVENLDALLRKMKSDADGEFPFVAQKVIAQQFAATGEVLSLYQVEDILLREEDEKKSGGNSVKEYSPDNKSKSKRHGDSGFASGTSTRGRGNGGGCDSGEDSDGSDRDDKRDILG